MKRFKLLAISIFIVAFISCSDDNTTTPSKSELNGTWIGQTIVGSDTARYNITISENNGVISGSGEMYAFHKYSLGSMTATETSINSGTLSGSYKDGIVKIHFINDTTDHFIGTISENKLEVSGKLHTYFIVADFKAQFDILLKNELAK